MGPDFSLSVHPQELCHNSPDVVMAVLFEEQRPQVEAADSLVLVEQLDRADLINLPPLRADNRVAVVSSGTGESLAILLGAVYV